MPSVFRVLYGAMSVRPEIRDLTLPYNRMNPVGAFRNVKEPLTVKPSIYPKKDLCHKVQSY